jgi:hypothetical protein
MVENKPEGTWFPESLDSPPLFVKSLNAPDKITQLLQSAYHTLHNFSSDTKPIELNLPLEHRNNKLEFIFIS